jgi:hypothetical protein
VVRALTSSEFRELRAWLDYEGQAWDGKFEAEVAAGEWDARAEGALRDHAEGMSTPL